MSIGTSIDLEPRRGAVRISTVLAACFVAAATPALSQGAMGPGAAPMAPQPRVAPAPQAPVAAPQMPTTAPTPITPVAPQQTGTFTIRGNEQQLKEPAGTQGTRAVIGGNIATAKLVSPSDGALVGGPDSKAPIAFRWTPLIPRPQEPTTYRLRVWQLMQGQNGTQAMQERQPVATVDVNDLTSTSIQPPSCAQGTCSFVWSVQALNRDGKPVGGNNGISEPFGFRVAGAAGGTTPRSGTTSPTGEPAGLRGSTAVVAILALEADNNSGAIFDRWGNLFAESKGNGAAPNLTIVSTDRARGSVAQTSTDQKGLFKVPSTPGVHEITLPAKDIEAAYIKIVEIKGNESPDNALRGSTAVVALLAFKVPGAATGGGRQDYGLARGIPRGAATMQVKLNVEKDGTVSTVDWGDGAGPQTLHREGKPIGGNGTSGIVGRTLFVGEAPKR